MPPTEPVPLNAGHDVSPFDCGEPALNDWLHDRALKNESRFSRTYVVCEGARVVAYVTIAAGAVELATAPGRLRRNAPDAIPVSVIGRLVVDLADALRRIVLASQTIGIAAVLIHAKSEVAKHFYLRCAEFIEYPADSRTLFLPIETIYPAID